MNRLEKTMEDMEILKKIVKFLKNTESQFVKTVGTIKNFLKKIFMIKTRLMNLHKKIQKFL